MILTLKAPDNRLRQIPLTLSTLINKRLLFHSSDDFFLPIGGVIIILDVIVFVGEGELFLCQRNVMSANQSATTGKLDNYFKLTARGTTVRKEMIAGLTTFWRWSIPLLSYPVC